MKHWLSTHPKLTGGVMVFALAFAVRLGLVLLRGPDMSGGEPLSIANALVRGQGYANAYGDNVGATAHCAPLLPLILAAVVQFVGTGVPCHLLMAVLASGAASLGFALIPALGILCGFGFRPSVLAGVAGALLPMTFFAQTAGIFDAPYTLLALVALSCLMARCWVRESFTFRIGALIGLGAGTAALMNPTVLSVLAAWLVAGLWRFRARRGPYLRLFAAIACCVLSMLAPWAIRNQNALGRLIWTRSDLGLELQLSNNDHATANLEKNMRDPRRRWNHPYVNDQERQKLARLGEVAYMDTKQQEAWQWVRAHPAAFARLTLQRIVYFWFPPMVRWWQTVTEAVVTVLGIAGLVFLFWKRHPCALLFAAVLGAYPAIYAVVEVSARYRCPLEPFLILLGVVWVVAPFQRRYAPPGERHPPAPPLVAAHTTPCLDDALD